MAALLLTAGLVLAVMVATGQAPASDASAPVPTSGPTAGPTSVPMLGDAVVERAAEPPREPPPASPTRLLPVATSPAGEGGYSLVRPSPGASVARFDPCRAIDVRVNPAGAPSGWKRQVEEALAAASEASGLSLELVGTTTEPPSQTREAVQPKRYGHTWAPVLIAWTDERSVPGLAGEVLGLGGQIAYGTKKQSRLVSGFVYLDGPGLAGAAAGLTGPVLLHEIGHLLGLDHVDDPAQLMYPKVRADVSTFADGDRRGLAYAGSGPCLAPQ